MLTDTELLQIQKNVQDVRAWMAFKRQALIENKPSTISRYGWKNLQSRTWTPILNPGIKTTWDYPRANVGVWADDRLSEWVPQLIQKRRECLQAEGIDPTMSQHPGKILASVYADSIYCTAAESVSDLFVDFSERPTWDCWIGWSNRLTNPGNEVHGTRPILLAWIPKEEWDLAQGALDATPYENLHWVADLNLPWATALKKLDR